MDKIVYPHVEVNFKLSISHNLFRPRHKILLNNLDVLNLFVIYNVNSFCFEVDIECCYLDKTWSVPFFEYSFDQIKIKLYTYILQFLDVFKFVLHDLTSKSEYLE